MLGFWRSPEQIISHSWKEVLVKNGLLVVLLLAGATFVLGQTTPASPSPSSRTASQKPSPTPTNPAPGTSSSGPESSATQSAKPSLVSPDATVITITGLCAASASPGACTTTISKKEVEAISNAVSPEMLAQ